jgi:lysophospholipase L1-like esterase
MSVRARRLFLVSFGLLGEIAWAGCSAEGTAPVQPTTGGAPTGGTGSMVSGGTAPSATGGVPSTGGAAIGSGGAALTGGTSGGATEGGATSGGLASASGGASSSGGDASAGSSSSGASGSGSTSKGGGDGSSGGGKGGATGGAKTSGGASTTGGNATGGSANTGGSLAGGNSGTTPVTVWIAGDSTVQNCSGSCPCGWGSQFKPNFNSLVTVNNSAVGGRSVRSWLYTTQSTADASGECLVDKDSSGNPIVQARWTTMLNGMKTGDYLFIQFGINDGAAACNTAGAEGRHVGITAFKTTYGMMAQAAKDRGANPVFLTPVSAISCNGSTARGTRGAYVTATIEAGMTYGVPVIDLHQLSVNLYNSLAFCPVPGGDVSASTTGPVGAFFCEDHTHFEAAGAKQIAELIAKALRDQNIGLAAYLK